MQLYYHFLKVLYEEYLQANSAMDMPPALFLDPLFSMASLQASLFRVGFTASIHFNRVLAANIGQINFRRLKIEFAKHDERQCIALHTNLAQASHELSHLFKDFNYCVMDTDEFFEMCTHSTFPGHIR